MYTFAKTNKYGVCRRVFHGGDGPFNSLSGTKTEPKSLKVFELAGYKTSTTHLAQTLVQQHCWHRARQNADWAL